MKLGHFFVRRIEGNKNCVLDFLTFNRNYPQSCFLFVQKKHGSEGNLFKKTPESQGEISNFTCNSVSSSCLQKILYLIPPFLSEWIPICISEPPQEVRLARPMFCLDFVEQNTAATAYRWSVGHYGGLVRQKSAVAALYLICIGSLEEIRYIWESPIIFFFFSTAEKRGCCLYCNCLSHDVLLKA